jgi:predicted alpha/beta superfamily hydrolase
MSISAGDVRLHERFRSRYLRNTRSLIVGLPPGYRERSATRHPVIYMHDGQNLFDPATAFGGQDWHVRETARELISAGRVEPVIIVGIYNAGERRIDEYAPTQRTDKGGGGRADDYGRMLIHEIMPFIDRTYRTGYGPAHTGMIGSSLGGLLTLYLGLHFPGLFGRLGLLSPSVWWDDRMILREVAALTGKPALRIWLDAGTSEGRETIKDVRALRNALAAKNWTLGKDLSYREVAGGEHNERSWAARLGTVLEFLFPPRPSLA